MGFKERLKEKRMEANLTQVDLAKKVSVSTRTIQNYEMGTRKPANMSIVEKIATVLNTTPEYLLGPVNLYVVAAHEKGGAKAARDIDEARQRSDRFICQWTAFRRSNGRSNGCSQ